MRKAPQSNRLRRTVAVGLAVLCVFVASPPSPIGADTPVAEAPQSLSVATSSVPPSASVPSPIANDFSLGITPVRLSVGQADIGKVQQVTVSNQGKSTVPVVVGKRNFTVATDGAVVYQEEAPYSASDWVSVAPQSFDLAPGARQTVTATITLPQLPDLGDHQVALTFVAPSGGGEGNIKINRGIAAPMYITVPGPIDDSVTLDDLSGPGFAVGGPVTLTAQLQNTGTVHRDFRDSAPLRIDAAGPSSAFPDFTVTRGAVRDVSVAWEPPLMCICNPSVAFTNADGSVQTATVRVVVFPLHLLAILIGAILVIGLGMLFARRGYRASVRKAAATMSRPVGRGDA